MKKWRHITLTDAQRGLLELGYQTGEKHYYRERCHAISLSDKGYKIFELALMFNKREDTIRGWFDRWEASGLKGLEIRPGRGLKPKLQVENEQLVELVKKKSKSSR